MNAPAGKDFQEADVEIWRPGRLWSLLDMLKISALRYIRIGQLMQDLQSHFLLVGESKSKEENEYHKAAFKEDLQEVFDLCKELNLSTSCNLIEPRLEDIPETHGEYTLLMEAIHAELKGKHFLYIPPDRASYYENGSILSERATKAFPTASQEMRIAGTCFSLSQNTACVFHAMRGAEIGLRSLGKKLTVKFPNHPIELAEWHNIIDQAESKIKEMKNLQKSKAKDDALNFYSQAAAQFRYFKDGWRVRAAHARVSYGETQAKEILDQTCSFFEVIAMKLKE